MNLNTSINFVESILEICNIGLNDRGGYVCTATQGKDNSSTTIMVNVLEGKLSVQYRIPGIPAVFVTLTQGLVDCLLLFFLCIPQCL